MVVSSNIYNNNIRRISKNEENYANRKFQTRDTPAVKKPKSSKKGKYAYIALKFSAVCLFMAGFMYQTLQFLMLYWTYPTVVDIQQSSPTYLEVPSFTFCNRVGYLFENVCEKFDFNPCANSFFAKFVSSNICVQFPYICINGTILPPDFTHVCIDAFKSVMVIGPGSTCTRCFTNSHKKIFQGMRSGDTDMLHKVWQELHYRLDIFRITEEERILSNCEEYIQNLVIVPLHTLLYGKFMAKNAVKRDKFYLLAQPLEEYLNCKIEFAGKSTKCNMENVLGSFYTTDDLPQFCYTIYSKWGQPNKTRDMIPKGATMKFRLSMNVTRRPRDSPLNEQYEYKFAGPWFNPPSDPSVQIAVHSPYFLPSPYFAGSSFLNGHNYEIRIKLSESHLMPLPYQTNCTDYMTPWYERGGKAPVNQLGIIQECRIEKTYEELGCVPVSMDYPHEYDLCKSCPYGTTCKWQEPPNNCTLLAEDYNQPCDSIVYEVEKEQVVITTVTNSDSLWADKSEALRLNFPQYDCEGAKMWKPECSIIEINVPFDRFEITNITYNAKFESLELFSVLGGYMGIWLGISLLTVFDLFSDVVSWIRGVLAKKKKKKVRAMRNKLQNNESYASSRNLMEPTAYHVW